ncbi:MAG: PQQ-binding-like beta-propeller repeat protein [Capsulimonas sp.]|uniref:outer membrane protein assembly factor BamB family protein n=1 Tax=Capsulimonas sp. TaxID=2494211 RepID=UPI003264A8C3
MNHRSIGVMRLLFGVSLLMSAVPAAHADNSTNRLLTPPFRTAWLQMSNPWADHFNVVAGNIRYAGPNGVGALRLKTGEFKWWSDQDEKYWLNGADFDKHTVYSSLYEFGLQAHAAKTGHLLWSMPVKCVINDIRVDENRLYCELHTDRIAALNKTTHQVTWETSLSAPGKPRKLDTDEITILDRDRLLIYAKAKISAKQELYQVFCLSRSAGRILWRSQPMTGMNIWSPWRHLDFRRVYASPAGKAYIALGDTSMLCLRLQDGKTLWRRADVGGSTLISSGYVISKNGGRINALDAATGKSVWSVDLFDDNMVAPVSVGSDLWTIAGGTLYCLSANGLVKWKWTQPGLGLDPGLRSHLAITNQGFLASVGNTLCLFRHGSPDKQPSDTTKRQTLAKKLVSRLGVLNVNEKNQLRALGDDAFPALIAELRKRLLAYQASPSNFDLYSRFSDCADVVEKFAKPKFTTQLLELLGLAKTTNGDNSTRQVLMNIVALKGDDHRTLPIFLNILKADKIDWNFGGIAQDAVLKSDEPAATAYLVSLLTDSAASPSFQWTAYLHAARTGDPAALKAVLARRTKQTVVSLAEAMELSKLGQAPTTEREYLKSQLVATEKDSSGRLFGLVNTGVAGSPNDLWIVRSEDGHWTDPIFTTLTLKQLGKLENFIQYINDPRFRMDTDGDSWTDLLEERLGTDPLRKDTDGDGIEDPLDKNPLAKPRPLSETEQVLSAAFEADTWSTEATKPTPGLITFPKGSAPFELIGSNWIILDKERGTKSPLDALYKHSPEFKSFGPPMLDLQGNRYHPKDPNSTVLWNANHTRARVFLGVSYSARVRSGVDFELRKFGTDWVVVGVKDYYIQY